MNRVVISGILNQDPLVSQTDMSKIQATLQIVMPENQKIIEINVFAGLAERARDHFKMGDAIRIGGQLSQKTEQGHYSWNIDWEQIHKPDYREIDHVA